MKGKYQKKKRKTHGKPKKRKKKQKKQKKSKINLAPLVHEYISQSTYQSLES